MKKESLYRPLTIAVPIVAVLCAGGVSGFEWNRLKRLEGEATATQAKLVQIDRELRSYQAQPQTERYPTVPRTPREQALFLDALRANADVCKVQLIRWSNTTPAAPPATDKPAAGPTTGVTAVVSTIEVMGRSENTRQFLYNVLRSRRLLNMSELKWVRDAWPNTHLTFTLTRYVAPQVELPASSVHPEQAHAGGPRESTAVSPASATVVNVADRTPRPDQAGGMSLPNPMDAPGIAHRTYQTRLEAGFSKLSELDRSQPSAPPHPPSGTDTKR